MTTRSGLRYDYDHYQPIHPQDQNHLRSVFILTFQNSIPFIPYLVATVGRNPTVRWWSMDSMVQGIFDTRQVPNEFQTSESKVWNVKIKTQKALAMKMKLTKKIIPITNLLKATTKVIFLHISQSVAATVRGYSYSSCTRLKNYWSTVEARSIDVITSSCKVNIVRCTFKWFKLFNFDR